MISTNEAVVGFKRKERTDSDQYGQASISNVRDTMVSEAPYVQKPTNAPAVILRVVDLIGDVKVDSINNIVGNENLENRGEEIVV